MERPFKFTLVLERCLCSCLIRKIIHDFLCKSGIAFNEEEAIKVVTDFMNFYWESNIFPEVVYIQSTLPTILPYASDSTYAKAMTSVQRYGAFC